MLGNGFVLRLTAGRGSARSPSPADLDQLDRHLTTLEKTSLEKNS